ncbi:SPOR domain-containing protein [Flavobacterium sp. 3HN19-14]|uniref:SPOR domain-containing protein n=1 Tax=Flavobacterium sp. 3HN19-14 TaxID=3448133 RepID=UPI003EE42160
MKEQKLPYHIVAGAFRDERNAQRIFEKLSNAGFKSRRLQKNRYGLFPVLYGSYASYGEAQAAMREIHKTQSSEAWLLIDEL